MARRVRELNPALTIELIKDGAAGRADAFAVGIVPWLRRIGFPQRQSCRLSGPGWARSGRSEACRVRPQYSPLIRKNEPRMVPASRDFCRANLNCAASSAGTSMPSDSLNPTARLSLPSIEYMTLMHRPLS